MRFNAAFASVLVSSASLLGYVHAEEAEAEAPSSSAAAPAEKPTFTVCHCVIFSIPYLIILTTCTD